MEALETFVSSQPVVHAPITEWLRTSHNLRGRAGPWHMKFCQHNNVVRDICEREAFGSLLARMVGIPAIDCRVHQAAPLLPPGSLGPEFVQGKCVVMPHYESKNFQDDRETASASVRMNPRLYADIFAFCHWIGDEDRGLLDVLVVNGGPMLIDFGLCGPSFWGSRLRGAHPAPQEFDRRQELVKSFPGKRSLVAFVIRDCGVDRKALENPLVIDRISALTDDEIRKACLLTNMDARAADVLIARRNTLRVDYSNWLHEVLKYF